ncbi:SUMO-activating enzyme subunit 1 [Wickerhamomyces ciferrii]|uniref:SUMO-activating enzyme subunit 1 n=1 Tax=Wickerhamomyces ciferrii (strain ATCC 14091 / BCRC 22168 / CBS 111 / JCM 3599 / NBRC 0793 / NRRL Y-1031 F-60-10) TaxID=1206466 RepID=K0KC37_WICCF|nr:SUMO-activating enzyme subunit 1 [Wickerhamomyces ciferrii]CCH42640.1 SUMO-activating enzyme subunit 1 [Wickerhamomyces ciferrii]
MSELSADELALYDRQLRVWGADGQNKIKNASILVINLNGVGTEIIKNLTLSGIGSIEILDPSVVTEDDLTTQFFLEESDLGKSKVEAVLPKIQDMNPRVQLTINSKELPIDDLEYFKKFKLIIANNLDAKLLQKLNNITRDLNISLYTTTTHGLYGYFFSDLILDISQFTKKKMPISRKLEKISSNQEIIQIETTHNKETNEFFEKFTLKSKFIKFEDCFHSKNLTKLTKRAKKNVSPLLSIFLALYELELNSIEINLDSLKTKSNEIQLNLGLNEITNLEIFEKILKQLNFEISPVAAILGGTLSQDVINYISKKEIPINNLLILDGDNFTMPIYEL